MKSDILIIGCNSLSTRKLKLIYVSKKGSWYVGIDRCFEQTCTLKHPVYGGHGALGDSNLSQ